MPNKPATPVRCFRMPDEVWEAILRCADDEGMTATEVVLRAVRRDLRDRY